MRRGKRLSPYFRLHEANSVAILAVLLLDLAGFSHC